MKALPTNIPDVLIVEPKVFGDNRGFFFENFNQQVFNDVVGQEVQFVQDNHSHSVKDVLRGLHYQTQQPQGKLVRVVQGVVYDVAVDLRKFSTTFGQWVGTELSDDNHRQVWIPPGFAHGFVVLSESADVLYKTTNYYEPKHERCLAWNDTTIGIRWPISSEPILSEKDSKGEVLRNSECFL